MNKSSEDYLEAILVLEGATTGARITDIAEYLKVSKPSVNRAMKVLAEKGYVTHETYGKITLTEKGKSYASMVYSRHTTLVAFLRDILNVSEAVSENDACLIEHDVSSETMEKIRIYLEMHKGK
ncbi:MAG: metal-dependent transcriptional regulator [Sphaerochaetaceae bacterium]|jgi:Mn-dependent DtxR family transcriptional regulator|nr:metal-dependent transcriptional regulator [Sphaerochaetaceae bacterium]